MVMKYYRFKLIIYTVLYTTIYNNLNIDRAWKYLINSHIIRFKQLK